MESYLITVYEYGKKKGYDRVYTIWAKNLDNARRNLILEYGGQYVSLEISKEYLKTTRFVGTLDIQGRRYNWQPTGKNSWYKVDAPTGMLKRGD